jgi:hypothetical protein
LATAFWRLTEVYTPELSCLRTSQGIAASLKQQSLRLSRQYNVKDVETSPSLAGDIYTARQNPVSVEISPLTVSGQFLCSMPQLQFMFLVLDVFLNPVLISVSYIVLISTASWFTRNPLGTQELGI